MRRLTDAPIKLVEIGKTAEVLKMLGGVQDLHDKMSGGSPELTSVLTPSACLATVDTAPRISS